MLSRLPITLAELKAGNLDQRYLKVETIFMNTENSKTNETSQIQIITSK